MASLARSVPKPLKVPSIARSVHKPLKVPSLARSVPKTLKVPSLARSVPKPCVGEAEGPQTRHYHRCRPPTSWSSAARYEVRLSKVIVGSEVTSTDSPKLIVGSECGTTPPS